MESVLDEVEEGSVGVVKLMWRLLQSGILAVGLAILYFLGRLVRNRLVHALSGNPAAPTSAVREREVRLLSLLDEQASFEVRGQGRGMHRVLKEGASWGCACRSFVATGSCGHIDAARAFLAEVVQPGPAASAVQFDTGGASTALARGRAALPSAPACLEGIVRKARELGTPTSDGCLGLRSRASAAPQPRSEPPSSDGARGNDAATQRPARRRESSARGRESSTRDRVSTCEVE